MSLPNVSTKYPRLSQSPRRMLNDSWFAPHALSLIHILKAASDFKAEHYMGDVARVHAQVLRKQAK